jgi:hypothetical protein
MASLIASDGTSFELADGETLVGRGERQVGDPPKVNLGHLPGGLSVSRQHIRLRQEQDEWHLEVERESTNDTFVDGYVLPKGFTMPLKDGARLQLGEVMVVFRGASELGGEDEEDENDTLDREPVHLQTASPTTLLVSTSPPVLPQAGPWVARLPERSRLFEALGLHEVRRVNPFEGLMVDAQTWADEQAYHRAAAQLHLLSEHGWGIVDGLEVVITPGAVGALLVRAGVAVDPLGRTLLVAADTQLTAPLEDGGPLYVTLQYAEEHTQPQSAWDGDEHATRVLERTRLSVDRQRPEPPALELARLVVAGELRDAADPTSPQPGEVDLRFRERQLVRPRPDLSIAQLLHPPVEETVSNPDTHRLGLRFVARELAQTTSYRARWAGTVQLDRPLPSVSVLYFTGLQGFPALAPEELEHLRAYLLAGGVLFADPCREGNWSEFTASVETVVGDLGVELKPVERWHPVLLSRHVLAAPPLPVPGEPPLREGGGIILSSSDFGCGWQGGPRDQALGRERIRAALELGVNVAVFGQQRRRPLDVLDFEA